MRGRPTKYKPEYCDLLLEMVNEGASFTEFCAKVGISRQTFHNWKDANEDFMDAYTRAELEGQAYWEKRLRSDLMIDSRSNAQLVKLYFANRFGWSDKQAIDHKSADGSMTPKPTTIEIVAGEGEG